VGIEDLTHEELLRYVWNDVINANPYSKEDGWFTVNEFREANDLPLTTAKSKLARAEKLGQIEKEILIGHGYRKAYYRLRKAEG